MTDRMPVVGSIVIAAFPAMPWTGNSEIRRRPAIVTTVHSPTNVNLTVFMEEGDMEATVGYSGERERQVRLKNLEFGEGPWRWTWPVGEGP